jgi:hypothetical protein
MHHNHIKAQRVSKEYATTVVGSQDAYDKLVNEAIASNTTTSLKFMDGGKQKYLRFVVLPSGIQHFIDDGIME